MKLFMIVLGCRPFNRITEQHDVFFGVAEKLEDLKPAMEKFWAEGKSTLHIDVWREVTTVDGYSVEINSTGDSGQRLYFVNLGGYKPAVFDELHQKLLVVANSMPAAVEKAKQTDFFRENSFPGAHSHIDEKFGFDVDEVEEINDLLSRCGFPETSISLHRSENLIADKIHCGYLPLSRL